MRETEDIIGSKQRERERKGGRNKQSQGIQRKQRTEKNVFILDI